MEIHLLINYGPMEAFVNRYLMGDNTRLWAYSRKETECKASCCIKLLAGCTVYNIITAEIGLFCSVKHEYL